MYKRQVVRFATSLGYKGYPDFQKALEELVRNKLNSVKRLEVTYGRIRQSQILETVLQSDRDKIKTTLEKIDADAYETRVKIGTLDTDIKNKVCLLYTSFTALPQLLVSLLPLCLWQVFVRRLSIMTVSYTHLNDRFWCIHRACSWC